VPGEIGDHSIASEFELAGAAPNAENCQDVPRHKSLSGTKYAGRQKKKTTVISPGGTPPSSPINRSRRLSVVEQPSEKDESVINCHSSRANYNFQMGLCNTAEKSIRKIPPDERKFDELGALISEMYSSCLKTTDH
jgi:hypothetical protein